MDTVKPTLLKVSVVLSKIMEVANWVLDAALIIGIILFAVSGTVPFVIEGNVGDVLSIYGYEVQVVGPDGMVFGAVYVLTMVCGVIVASLVAMVFRNIYLICRLAQGQTSHAKGATPFQPDNVRMVREIGIFAIAIPVVQLIFDIIIRLVAGADWSTSGIGVEGFVFGVAMLCLSQVFAYGMQLQRDADGLI